MTTKLHVAKHPCATCPYLRATPPGIWTADEYAKLPSYDDGNPSPNLATFHCHQETTTKVATVCKGWLAVHPDSIAVRFAQVRGEIDPDDVPLKDDPACYTSGAEAAKAGLAGVEEPDYPARVAIDKLVNRRAHLKGRSG